MEPNSNPEYAKSTLDVLRYVISATFVVGHGIFWPLFESGTDSQNQV